MSVNSRPYRLGLTGGIASGKTEAAKRLSDFGATIIDADAISRQLTAPGGDALPQIRELFGDGVFHEDGSLDRHALGELVFQSESQRRALEGIIHPAVQREMLRCLDEAKQSETAVCVLVVPLLFETAMDAMCDEVWTTSVEESEQERRIMERDGTTREQARARMDSQMPRDERDRLSNLVIHTNRSLDQTAKELKKQYDALLRRIDG